MGHGLAHAHYHSVAGIAPSPADATFSLSFLACELLEEEDLLCFVLCITDWLFNSLPHQLSHRASRQPNF